MKNIYLPIYFPPSLISLPLTPCLIISTGTPPSKWVGQEVEGGRAFSKNSTSQGIFQEPPPSSWPPPPPLRPVKKDASECLKKIESGLEGGGGGLKGWSEVYKLTSEMMTP